MTEHSLLTLGGLSAFALILSGMTAQAQDPVLQITIHPGSYAQNIEDALGATPGVTASKRFGAEVRLTIRGSGLSFSF